MRLGGKTAQSLRARIGLLSSKLKITVNELLTPEMIEKVINIKRILSE